MSTNNLRFAFHTNNFRYWTFDIFCFSATKRTRFKFCHNLPLNTLFTLFQNKGHICRQPISLYRICCICIVLQNIFHCDVYHIFRAKQSFYNCVYKTTCSKMLSVSYSSLALLIISSILVLSVMPILSIGSKSSFLSPAPNAKRRDIGKPIHPFAVYFAI